MYSFAGRTHGKYIPPWRYVIWLRTYMYKVLVAMDLHVHVRRLCTITCMVSTGSRI